MRRWFVILVWCLSVTGCYSRDAYTEDVTQAYCTLYEDCDYLEQVDYIDYAECEFEVSQDQDPENFLNGCDYDWRAAVDCVEGINQMQCVDLAESDFPVDCERVCTRGQ